MPQEDIAPPPLINGHDLMAKGYRPGPALGRMLEAEREAQLQGEITGRREALDTAERVAAEIGAPRD